MKAAVLTRVGEIAMEADWPEPEPGQRRRGGRAHRRRGLRLRHRGLVGRAGGGLPWIVGHEGTGTIVAVGEGVSRERIGDRVVIEPNYPCGSCDGCLRGRTAMCVASPVRRDQHPRPAPRAGRRARPVRVDGPRGLTDQDLVCVEPMTVALHAARLGHAAAGATA